MKRLIFLLLLWLAGYQAYAQDPQLFENPWYLQVVIIDGIEYERPFPTFDALLYLSPSWFDVAHHYCEEGFGSPIMYLTGENIFNIDDGGVIVIGICADPDVLNFMDKHYKVYLLDNQFAKNPFTYILETVNDHTSLTIINVDGDQAIYGDALLTTSDVSIHDISIYPNPVQELLIIDGVLNIDIEAMKIYDLLGKMIIQENDKINYIDMSNLNKGIYFLKIETNQGVLTKKIIKQ